jgi:hypothetical protein
MTSVQPEGGKLRKLKILVATLAMTLMFAAPAFATVLDPLELEVGAVHAHTHFLGLTEVEVGNFSLSINSSD